MLNFSTALSAYADALDELSVATETSEFFESSPAAGARPPDAVPVDTSSERDGPAFAVGKFNLEYREDHPDHPKLSQIFPHEVALFLTPSGYVSPSAGDNNQRVVITGLAQKVEQFHASALASISRSLLKKLQKLGLLGIYVLPDARDIDPRTEDDLRAPHEFTLRYQVSTGRIQEVRTIAIGDRIDGDWVVDHKYHSDIRTESPLQPERYAAKGTSDLLQKDVLEDYLYRLNRHPGRYVEAALASSNEGDGVALDYRVTEPRPWTPYLQVANTGTQRTNKWQSRLGVIHRELTNRNDILNLEFINAGFDNLNGIYGSYEAPWFSKKRPRWMKTSGFEPSWLAWADRDSVPWWGMDRLRWRISGGFSRVEIGLGNILDGENTTAITEDWNLGGQLIYQVYQHHNWFVDVFAGYQHRQVDFDNRSLNNREDLALSIGSFGAKVERVNEYSSLFGRMNFEVGSTDGNSEEASGLGRFDADADWYALKWNFGVSHYLEPLLNRKAWEDPTTTASSTLAHELALSFRGQYAFDNRLIPQVSQVVGGLYSVRGFEQGVAVGDSVYITSAEYRFHLPRALSVKRVPMQLPFVGPFRATPQQVYGRPDWDLVIRTFVDLGYTDREGDREVAEFDQLLVSAGVGLEADFMGKARVRVDWARGIKETHSNSVGSNPIDKGGEFHFLFSIMY